MSRSATILLGIFLGVLTLGFACVARFTGGAEAFLAAFCFVGMLACLVRASRPVTLRLVAGTVFLVCLAYLIDMLIRGPILGRTRNVPSIVNALMAFSVFGLPAAYVMITGQYPRWGRHAHAFESSTAPNPDGISDRAALHRDEDESNHS